MLAETRKDESREKEPATVWWTPGPVYLAKLENPLVVRCFLRLSRCQSNRAARALTVIKVADRIAQRGN